MKPSAHRSTQGECLTPTLPENYIPSPLVLDSAQIDFSSQGPSVEPIMAEDSKQILLKIAESVNSLNNGVIVSQTIRNKQTRFDGSNAEDFTKWLAEMDDIHRSLGKDERQTIWAASQLLKGPALTYFQNIRNQCPDWATLKGHLLSRYSNLNPAEKAKRQLKTAVQQ